MSTARATPVYDKLVIVASSSATEIGLGDDAGHLGQNVLGALRTHLVPGDDVVACGLGTAPYAIHRTPASRYTPTERGAGPTCARPTPPLPPAKGSAKVGC